MNALPAMVGYWDSDLSTRLANDAYLRYYGITPREMEGKHIKEVLGESLFERSLPYIDGVLAGTPQLFDREIVTPSGEIAYTQVSYVPDEDDEGHIRGFFVLVTDITARHHVELALHESEERYRALVEQLPGGAITVVGPDLTLRWLGGAATKAFDYDVDSLIGRPIRETSGGGEHGERIEYLYRLALSGEHVSTEVRSSLNGHDFTFEIAPLRSRDDRIVGALGVAQDISGRKRDEAAVRLRSQIIGAMAEGALVIREREGTVIHANGAAERMFGYEPGELDGRPVSSLDAPLGDSAHGGAIRSARKDGSTFWRRATNSRIDDAEHGPLLVSVVSDVTEQRRHEAEVGALAAIATLAAESAEPAAVFAAVADHVASIFEASTALVVRYDAVSGAGGVVAANTSAGASQSSVLFDLGGDSAPAQVYRTGASARAVAVQAPGRGTEVAAPVKVAGRLWGCLVAEFDALAIPPDAEARLARFTQLVATAIANAEAWEALRLQAATDSLTGLANHHTFHDRLEEELGRATRYGRDVSLILIDLDHFKIVNDTLGHQRGDRLLVAFAQVLAHEARIGELVGRLGGEEFGWILPEATSAGALRACERVRELTSQPTFDDGIGITFSAGICSTESARYVAELIGRADSALYEAKRAGRNRTIVHGNAPE